MALAVAMVACESATGAQGDLGPQGDPGDTGPAGPSGTTDNEPPMATMDLPMVYLALKGTGATSSKTGIDLSKHFMDAENAALTYKAESSDKTVATVEIKAGMLSVTGKGAGKAAVTVNAYDGVNTDPAMSSFDVMVVAKNARPALELSKARENDNPSGLSVTADPVTGEQEKLRAKLYRTNVRGKTTISATIHAGDDPFADEVVFSYAMGKDGDEDNIVDVEITPKSGAANMWEIKLTPLKAGMQNVYVTVKDKFGATAETPESGDGTDDDVTDDDDEITDQLFQFVAFVNTVPKLDMALADKTILSDATHDYIIAEHFDTDEASVAAGPKIGKMHKPAEAPGSQTANDGVANGGEIGATDRTNDATCSATSSDAKVASVARFTNGSATSGVEKADAIRVTGVGAGKAIVTVTCRDNEGPATGTATITVRAAR